MTDVKKPMQQYVVTLRVNVYGNDQADALRVLTDAIESSCGRDTVSHAFIEESSVKAVKK